MEDVGVVRQMALWQLFGMHLNRDLRIKGKSWLAIRTAVKSCLAARLRHELFAGDDGPGRAEIGIDGEMGGGVARSLVLKQGLLQQRVDAVALPIHKAASSS